jgi:tetratricopeptide (TPR) repeat protein
LIQHKDKEALAYLDKALSLQPGNVDALQLITASYLRKKEYKKAEDRIQNQFSLARNPVFMELLADAYEAEGNMQQAESCLKKASEISPDLSLFHLTLANFYMRRKLTEKAKIEYSFTLQKNPTDIEALMALGTIYQYEKNYEKAIKCYENVLKINADVLPAANNLAYLYAEHGGNIDVALDLAQKAKRRATSDPFITDTLGWIYYKKNVPYTAISYLKDANEKAPNQPLIKYHLGMVYYKTGKLDLAKRELSAALQLDQNFANAGEANTILKSIK